MIQGKYRVGAAVGVTSAAAVVGLLLTHSGGATRSALGDRSAPPTAATGLSTSSPKAAASPGGVAPELKPSPKTSTQTDAATPKVAQVTVSSSGSVAKDHRMIRVVSARTDLTGQRELAWAADQGHAVGSARCTQNFHFDPGSPAGERKTLLLCWRTSPTKSVYTLAVDVDRRPSEKASLTALQKAWNRLG
jgi:hypothetical protein